MAARDTAFARIQWVDPCTLAVRVGRSWLTIATIDRREDGAFDVDLFGWTDDEDPDSPPRPAQWAADDAEAAVMVIAIVAHRTGLEVPPWPGHLDADEGDPLG